MKSTPMYLWYIEMYLATKDAKYPMAAFKELHNKKRPVNYSTAEKKWKIINAAYEVFTTSDE